MGWENLEADPNDYYGQIYQGIISAGEKAGYLLSNWHVYLSRACREPVPYLPDPELCLGIIFVGMMNEPTVQFYSRRLSGDMRRLLADH